MVSQPDSALHSDASNPSRREQILRAAAQLFAERGSRAVGVDDDLGALSDADARSVRTLQRRYVEEWVGVLGRLDPAATTESCRARAHAVFGLINSTPHSAGRLTRPEMAALLTRMAEAAARG
jgi:hypothetical protein